MQLHTFPFDLLLYAAGILLGCLWLNQNQDIIGGREGPHQVKKTC